MDGRFKQEDFDYACKKEFITEYFELKYGIERTLILNK